MSHYLYLILILGSFSVPLLYSIFEKKLHFIQYSKEAFISMFLVAIPFLIWDGWFTKIGVWGFNPKYHLSIEIFKMPIEEWLFFFCIPYACLFTHEALKYLFPNFVLSKSVTLTISFLLIGLAVLLLIFNFNKWYSAVNFSYFFLLILYSLKYHLDTLREYFPSFLVILVPFLFVNGILTGSFIEAPVVWYNNSENLNFRIFTVPFEDIFYAFTMLFSVQLIFNDLKKKKNERK